MVLPPPTHVTATISLGNDAYVELPTPTDLVDIELPEPPEGLLPVYEHLTPGSASRITTRSDDGRTVTTSIIGDTGEVVHPTNGMIWREVHESAATITADDPLSFECVGEARGDASPVRRRDPRDRAPVGSPRAPPTGTSRPH